MNYRQQAGAAPRNVTKTQYAVFPPSVSGQLCTIGKASEKIMINKEALNDTQRKILNLLAENTQLSAAKIAEHIGISRRNVESNMKKLKDQGILIRHGSPKNGYWEIIS